jgi:hypothetical protein
VAHVDRVVEVVVRVAVPPEVTATECTHTHVTQMSHDR